MQISVESTGALERRMEVSVPKEQIEQAVDERLKRVSRTAKLKGFRPGKAPIKVIRQQFGAQVRQEVLSDLMQSSFAQAVTEQKLVPAAGPRIEPIAFAPGEDLKYRAVFEIYPEIELKASRRPGRHAPGGRGHRSRHRGDAAKSARAASRRSTRSSARAAKATASRWTSRARSTVKPFEGSKGDDVAVILGSGRMLKDFDDGHHRREGRRGEGGLGPLSGRVSQQGAGRQNGRLFACR